MKNAITVVDQELIDWFDCHFEKSGMSTSEFDMKTEDLLQMAKDLIEINAELTKSEQKYRTCIKSLLNSDTRKSKERAIFKAKDLLKGDSDE